MGRENASKRGRRKGTGRQTEETEGISSSVKKQSGKSEDHENESSLAYKHQNFRRHNDGRRGRGRGNERAVTGEEEKERRSRRLKPVEKEETVSCETLKPTVAGTTSTDNNNNFILFLLFFQYTIILK